MQDLTHSDCPDSHSGEETPVLIPNTAVKLSSADGTDLETDWESRTLSGRFFVTLYQGETVAMERQKKGAVYGALFCFVSVGSFLVHASSRRHWHLRFFFFRKFAYQSLRCKEKTGYA